MEYFHLTITIILHFLEVTLYTQHNICIQLGNNTFPQLLQDLSKNACVCWWNKSLKVIKFVVTSHFVQYAWHMSMCHLYNMIHLKR